jgi:hypothetical protein
MLDSGFVGLGASVVSLHYCRYIIVMALRFSWDSAKAESNLRKHRVSFALAARVFADPFALVALDRVEEGEERWQAIGLVEGVVVLLVAYTLRGADDGGEVIRLISARRADPKERRRYERERRHQVRT